MANFTAMYPLAREFTSLHTVAFSAWFPFALFASLRELLGTSGGEAEADAVAAST
jgi:hypothetical protein